MSTKLHGITGPG